MERIKDVVIQDLNDYQRPVVTEMVVLTCIETGGMLHFTHPDNSVTIIKLKEGWNVSITLRED